jgi:hypothetical protein
MVQRFLDYIDVNKYLVLKANRGVSALQFEASGAGLDNNVRVGIKTNGALFQ